MRSRFSLPLFAWLLHFFLSACGASSTQNLPPPHRPSPPYPLTVLLIYDQLASWALLLHENALDPAGAIPTAAKEGVFVERMRYEYAVTLTAPGHASLATGLPPSIHGISTNYIWDRLRRKIVSIYDDGVHPVIGRQDRFASLAPLRAITLADRLVEHGHGRSRIVAIGMKDRSVLPLGGRHPTLSLWFDTKLARFTSTTALHLQLPKWLDDFQAHNDWRNYAHPWFPLRNHSDLGPDDAKGEGGCGFDSTFPHELTNPGDVEAFLCMPQATQLLFELARRAVIEESLGEDEIPDLLTISIASTDYIGHAFGPESWEVRDHLIRVDRMAGDFLRWLSSRTHYALVITSDHGVAPLPERAHNHHLPSTAKRVSSVEEKAALEEALQARFGPTRSSWVEAWVVPWVYLNRELMGDGPNYMEIRTFVLQHLLKRPGIGFAIDVHSPHSSLSDSEDLNNLLWASVPPDPPGDFLVFPSIGSIADDGPEGTSHGSPHPYDLEVPLLFFAPRLKPNRLHSPVPFRCATAILAHFLAIPWPRENQQPLPSLCPELVPYLSP